MPSSWPTLSTNNAAPEPEHSLEVALPFLQKALASFSIVPCYGAWALWAASAS
jgi:AmmeMemoRadiSam system protein B